MKTSKTIGLLSFGMLASAVFPQVIGNKSYVNTLFDTDYNTVISANQNALDDIVIASADEENTNDFVYLSDIPYISSGSLKSSVGWKTITMDKTTDGTSLQLKVEGSTVTFEKGVFAHAKSTVYYDLSQYNDTYAYFTTYYGVSAQRGSSGSVKFYIYTSVDGTNWNLETESNPATMNGNSAAKFVKIDIRGKKYLKLYADPVSDNGQDHSLYADAKFIKEGYSDNVTMSVAEYDALIKEKYSSKEIDEELELLLLQRNLVNKAGQYTLKTFINKSEANKEAFDWLMNNREILKLYTVGGKPDGTYSQALQVLSDLYATYKDDLNDETEFKNKFGTVKAKDLYLKMILSLSLTHSTRVGLWVDSSTNSNAIVRYAIYKNLHLAGKLNNDIFENLTVEEMRWVMNNIIDDEEIEWLNDLMKKRGLNDSHGAYQFISYTSGYNYNLDKYYSADNYDKWDAKYDLKSHNITYSKGHPRLWIVFEEGSVCGGLAKTWSNMRAVRGIPSSVVGQPGHAAAITYAITSDGRGYWNLVNDVFGWSNSGRTEKIGVRMPNEWGEYNIATYTSTLKPDSYVFLAQDAQNEYDKYEASEIVLLLEDVYKNDEEALEEIYWAALKEEKINFDALYGLTMLYKNSKTKTDEEKAHLAEVIIDTYTYHPLPMYDLIRNLLPTISNAGYKAKVVMLQEAALQKASKATSSNSLHAGGVKAVANNILGITDGDIASFSFSGTNSGKIILANRFSGSEVAWDYSLDGGNTWIQSNENTVTLTDEQLSSITAENDIKVHIIGVDYSEDNIFTINITKATLPSNLYRNDLENRLINATNTMEWRVKGTDEWTPIGNNSYRFNDVPEGSDYVEIEFRVFANGTCLPSDIATYKFWRDDQPRSRTYIPISHLSVARVSSEATANNGHAKHAIDGDYNTIWHSNYSGGDTDKYIDIKLDETKYISGLDYYPRQTGTNGRVNHGKMYVSMDGSTWKEVADFYWGNNASLKTITLDDSYEANYVRFKAITNYGDGRNFISAMAINLYEDLDGDRPRATVEYSTTENTTEAVTAIVKVNKEVTITDSSGYAYTQNADGDFEFIVDSNKTFKVSFVDENGKTGSIDVKVNCIVDYDFKFNSNGSAVISIGEKYMTDEGEIEWKYSIDGGNTWIIVDGDLMVSLTDEEIDAMTETNGLQLSINLIKYNPDAISDGSFNTNPDGTIGVSVSVVNGINIPDKTLYANDLENKIFGTTTEMEWRYVEFDDTGLEVDNDNSYTSIDGITITSSTKWTRFTEDTPKFKGEKKVQVRYAAYGNVLPGDEKTYRFTNVEQDEKHTYITINNYKVHDYSSETNRTGNYEVVGNAIDGNKYTMWHTSRTSTTDEKYITIELDKPRYITKVEAIGKENYEFGNIKDGSVYVSMDGINWEKVAECHDEKLSSVAEARTHTKKTFEFAAVYAKYIKVQNDVSHDYVGSISNSSVPADANWFLNLTMLNLYEDTNQVQEDTIVMVEYNVQGITNRDVEAHIYSPNGTIRVTNNGNSDTYIFTQNGDFIFEYEYLDSDGNWIPGTITASVGLKEGETEDDKIPHIDKEAPVAEFVYSETKKTKDSVTVSLIFNEQIIMLSEDMEDKKDGLGNYMLLFTENGTTNVTVKDLAGNIVTIPVTVDNIDKTAPQATVSYDPDTLTNGQVKVIVNFDEKIGSIVSDLEFIKNNEEGTSYYVMINQNINYTIEFTDEVGNKGSVNLFVDWIDKVIPTATVTYSENNETSNPVIVTFKTSKKVTYTGLDTNLVKVDDYTYTYEFIKNGTFTFTFKDEAGNIGSAVATVDWISSVTEETKVDVTYSNTDKTNKPVIATFKSNKKVIYTGLDTNLVKVDDYTYTYEFAENGTFNFEYIDEEGNKNSVVAIVGWINTVIPSLEVQYETLPSGDIIARLILKEGIAVIGESEYTFTDNGSYTFKYKDEYGNIGETIAEVTTIKKAANVSLKYSTTTVTGDNVIVTLITDKEINIVNNNGSDTYIFKTNGTFTFIYVDDIGEHQITANVDWIDKGAPTAEIAYSTMDVTNQNVVVTLVNPNRNIIITNNGGSETYTFVRNGTFTFEFIDEDGIVGSATAIVNWIDKEAPTAELRFSTTQLTNRNVIVTLVNPSEDITILDVPDGIYTFTENGSYVFKFKDKAGNVGSVTATVDWIDKEAPTADVEYSTKESTTDSVVVKLLPNEAITITNNGGSNTYIFTENGEFTFEFVDKAGNKGTKTVKVDWIDKKEPDIPDEPVILEDPIVTFSKSTLTNEDVIVTITLNLDYIITNNNGLNTYTFTKNGEFTFEYEDSKGNKGSYTVKVNWIDKEAPTVDVVYSTTDYTNKNVIVTLINSSEKITIINNNGSDTYTFTENGEFTFEFIDEAGNKGTKTVKVNWIDKEVPTADVEYSTKESTTDSVVVKLLPNEKVTIINNGGSNIYTFTENGEFTFEFIDEAGNKGTKTVKVDWIVKKEPDIPDEPVILDDPEVIYSNSKKTNTDVIVSIDLKDGYKITNNNGLNTYIFTSNGSFTFEYVDEYGNTGSYTVTVDWIDKSAVVASVIYDINYLTGKNVTASLVTNKKVIILNNNGNSTYTFTENGEFTFEFVDEYGNTGSALAKVYWISRKTDETENVTDVVVNNNGNNNSNNNQQSVDKPNKDDNQQNVDEPDDSNSNDDKKEEKVDTDKIDYSLIEKIIIAIPVIGILCFLVTKANKKILLSDKSNDDEETK